MKAKAKQIVQGLVPSEDHSSPIIGAASAGVPLPLKGQKKKKLFTEGGKEYFQIQPLTRMGQLRGFYQINSSISKLAQNICTNGVDKALMKLGEQIKYESNLKGKNHRQ